jgi:predicted O-methyltransferase YrrM
MYLMALTETVWHAIPSAIRERAWKFLAAHNVGPMPAVPPSATPSPTPYLTPWPEHLDSIVDAPTEMSSEERLFLYAIIRGIRPQRVLEIGTSQGGSTVIIANALQDNQMGEVAGIDPLPRIAIPEESFHGRFHLVTGTSPEVIEQARDSVAGLFDFVLLDGIHIYRQTARDISGALPYTCPNAYLLFHDAFHFGVSRAIDDLLAHDPSIHDCGYVCSTPRPVGDLLTHGGFRLLRKGSAAVDIEPLVASTWADLGKEPPHELDLVNHDIWYCDAIEPCDRCARTQVTNAASPTTGEEARR